MHNLIYFNICNFNFIWRDHLNFIYIIFSNHSLANTGHFHIIAIVSNAAMNVRRISFGYPVSISLDIYPEL